MTRSMARQPPLLVQSYTNNPHGPARLPAPPLLQFSSFAWHFVEADGEEQRGLYATLAGCLRAGDAAGAARWVRKYSG